MSVELKDLKPGDKVRFEWYGEGEYVEYVGWNPATGKMYLDYTNNVHSRTAEISGLPADDHLLASLYRYEEPIVVGDVVEPVHHLLGHKYEYTVLWLGDEQGVEYVLLRNQEGWLSLLRTTEIKKAGA